MSQFCEGSLYKTVSTEKCNNLSFFRTWFAGSENTNEISPRLVLNILYNCWGCMDTTERTFRKKKVDKKFFYFEEL